MELILKVLLGVVGLAIVGYIVVLLARSARVGAAAAGAAAGATWWTPERKSAAGHAAGLILYAAVSYLMLRGVVSGSWALAGAFLGTAILAALSFLSPWGGGGMEGKTSATQIVYFLGVAIALLALTRAIGAAAYQTRYGFEVISSFSELHQLTVDEIDDALDRGRLERGEMTEDEYEKRWQQRSDAVQKRQTEREKKRAELEERQKKIEKEEQADRDRHEKLEEKRKERAKKASGGTL